VKMKGIIYQCTIAHEINGQL